MEREEGGRRRGRKEEGGEVPGRARPVTGGVGVRVGVGGSVEGMARLVVGEASWAPRLVVGRPAATVIVLHPMPGLR